MNDCPSPAAEALPVLHRLHAKRRITPVQVAVLRSSELGFGVRSQAEAELMFAIERSDAEKCRAWGDLLVETMLDYLVWDEHPAGRLTEAAALWVSDQVGERPTPACMALLVAVLDEAEIVPAWFPQAVRVRARKVFARTAAEPPHLAA